LLGPELCQFRNNVEENKFAANRAPARNAQPSGAARIVALIAQAFSSRHVTAL